MYLIAGLGNPGRDYQDNRHNIGFMVADELASRFRLGSLRSKFGGDFAVGEPAGLGARVALLKPMEFMNLSGGAVQRAATFFQVEADHVIVVHDEIDLEFGRVKVKQGGGHGGHNGLRSMTEQIGPGYLRVRCGVGHPGHKDRVVGHVLGPFSKAEQKELPFLIGEAADAVEAIVKDGPLRAMNRFNPDKVPGKPKA